MIFSFSILFSSVPPVIIFQINYLQSIPCCRLCFQVKPRVIIGIWVLSTGTWVSWHLVPLGNDAWGHVGTNWWFWIWDNTAANRQVREERKEFRPGQGRRGRVLMEWGRGEWGSWTIWNRAYTFTLERKLAQDYIEAVLTYYSAFLFFP